MSNIEFDNDGVYLRWDDRVATIALFTYVRLLHPTLSQEELEQTEDYHIVGAYCKEKDPINVAVVLVQNYNNKENV